MAVLLQLTVAPATQDEWYEADARMGRLLNQLGGPPVGLMSHVVYPDGGGFVIADVWRTEADARRFVDEVLHPMLTELGLTAHETAVRQVWSFARP